MAWRRSGSIPRLHRQALLRPAGARACIHAARMSNDPADHYPRNEEGMSDTPNSLPRRRPIHLRGIGRRNRSSRPRTSADCGPTHAWRSSWSSGRSRTRAARGRRSRRRSKTSWRRPEGPRIWSPGASQGRATRAICQRPVHRPDAGRVLRRCSRRRRWSTSRRRLRP